MGTDRTSIHKPEYCLTSQGWRIVGQETIQVPIPKPRPYSLRARKFLTSRVARTPSGRAQPLSGVYLFWFVADGRLAAGHFERIAWMTWDLLRTGWLGQPSGASGWQGLWEFYGPMGISLVIGFGALLAAQLVARGPERWLNGAPATVMGFVYVWFFGAHVFAILAMSVGYLLAFLAAAKLGDAGAYFVGRFWGRRRLAPRTSPNKTVEGSLGGLAASAGCCVATAALLGLDRGLPYWALFGLVVGVLSQVGDLIESALKRSAGAKDSGQLFPTFGGVLDLVDSPLFSAPVALWLLVA